MKVLIAEDAAHICSSFAEVVQGEGYDTLTARNGKEALTLFRQQGPDYFCLEIMKPSVNGYGVCHEICMTDASVPAIFISTKYEEVDKVLGLDLGTDDYALKPFGHTEVVTRIRAVTRRCMAVRNAEPPAAPFAMHDLEVSRAQLRAWRIETVIDFSLRDVRFLYLLQRNLGSVVDRDTFFNERWGLDNKLNSHMLDQHISQLRKRVEVEPKNPELICTVHGAGYRYDG